MTSLSLPTFLRLKEGFSSSRSDGLNLGRRFNAGGVVQSSPRRVATVEPTAAMIAAFNRRYATGDFSYARPALKRRPKFKPSLRDEEQARLASKIQRAKMWVMTRMSSCPTNNSSDLNTEVETAVTVVAWAALGRVKRLLSAFE